MKKFTFFALAAFLFVALLPGCSGHRDHKVIIVSTNDIHATIDRFPQLATLVDSLRATGDPIVLVDDGDWSTGNPYADLYPRRGAPQIELMNALGYDVATLGNHEFDNGIDTLARRLAEAHFKIVSANIQTNGAMPQPAPYCFVDVGGVRLGFVGVITVGDGGHPEGFASSFGAATFSDPVTTAKKYAFLKDSCDLLIALTHIGFAMDTILAEQAPEFGLVIGGHSHTVLSRGGVWFGSRTPGEGTLITQTGSKLRYAGITTLTVNSDGEITAIDNRLVDLSNEAPEPKIAQMVAKFKNNPRFTQVVGQAAAHFNKNAVMSLYADAMREGAGVDVALANRGGVRIDYLNPGPITRGDLFMIEPFGNKAVVVPTMSEGDIKRMIMSKFNSEGKESHSIDLWPSGMSYKVVTGPDGAARDVKLRIAANSRGGLYRVAMSDYVESAYDLPRRANSAVQPTGAPITSLIEKYIAAHTPIAPDSTVRAVVGTR